MFQGGSPAIRLPSLFLIIAMFIGSVWVVRDLERREFARLTTNLPDDLTVESRQVWLAQTTDLNRLLAVANRLIGKQEWPAAAAVLARAADFQPELRDVQLLRAWTELQLHAGQPTANAQLAIEMAFQLDPLNPTVR